VQDAVYSSDRPWRERDTVSSPTATEVAVEIVDVLRCQLDDVEVAEIRLEWQSMIERV
jgi:hypothetical protein